MKFTRQLLAVFIPTLLATAAAQAANIYVSGQGTDGNNNTGTSQNSPLRSLAKAATLVGPGDTVFIMNGTYAPFKLTRSGTASAWITWKAMPGQTPELVSNTWNAIEVDASYQVIDGLTLTGNNDNVSFEAAEADYNNAGAGSPLYNGNGIVLNNRRTSAPRHHLTVRNCTIRKFGGGGIAAEGTNYIVLENNKVYWNAWYSRYANSGLTIFPANVGGESTGYHNIVRGNTLFNNKALVKWKQIDAYSDGNGFILDVQPADYRGRTLVSNNLVVNNGGSGIHSFKAGKADIVNNTAYMNGQRLDYADIYAQDSTDVRLRNNVVVSRSNRASNANFRNTNVTYDYNVYFGGRVAVRGPNDIVADPLFVNPNLDPRQGDFRVRQGSPAIDSGLRIAGTTPGVDLNQVARPQGASIDRGAYEYVPAPALTSTTALNGAVGKPLDHQLSANNGPVAYSASNLPAGLTLDASSGRITGTPAAAGHHHVTVTATGVGGSTSRSMMISVAPKAATK